MGFLGKVALLICPSVIVEAYTSYALQNVLDNTHGSTLYNYPTDFTRDIITKPIHSHNDYWRSIPFYTALSYGAISVEADVWLYKETLYVGHDRSSLTRSRTFDALYIQPILDTLQKENPESQFVDTVTRNGVYDTDPEQTLYLFVDVKTDGPKAWPYVLSALEPLRSKGYLSTVRDGKFIKGPVTVIGTGNAPLSIIKAAKNRDAFFDGPLQNLNTNEIDALVSPIASTSFKKQFGRVKNVEQFLKSSEIEKLREQVKASHAKGILARYWNLPDYPLSLRNQIWQLLVDEDVDLLNADDLKDAAGFWETNNGL